jgi:hypothetical protein
MGLEIRQAPTTQDKREALFSGPMLFVSRPIGPAPLPTHTTTELPFYARHSVEHIIVDAAIVADDPPVFDGIDCWLSCWCFNLNVDILKDPQA